MMYRLLTVSVLFLAFAKAKESTDDSREQEPATEECLKKGLTWGQSAVDNFPWLVRADCYGDPPGPCEPYHGDTCCDRSLPVLCINAKAQELRPNYDVDPTSGSMPKEYYRGWGEGYLALTYPVEGSSLTLSIANRLCASIHGEAYRMAEFHDGKYVIGMNTVYHWGPDWPSDPKSGGWTVTAYGYLCPETRFWVYIDDQPANCWN